MEVQPSSATRRVDNPLYDADQPLEHRVIVVERSLRDPLDKLHHTKRIGDAEFAAGRMLQRLLGSAEVGRVRSQDPSREPVDGGGHVPDVMTDNQLRAINALQIIWRILGHEDAVFVRAVLADGMMPEEYGRKMGKARGDREISHWGWLFAKRMQRLAVHFGLAS